MESENGDGYEIAYEPERTKVLAVSVIVDGAADIGPIKEQERICRGDVRGDKCWSGRFLRWRHVPGTYREQLELHKYRDGQRVSTMPYELAKLALPPDPAKDEGSSAWPRNWRHHEAREWPVVSARVRAP